MKITGKKMKLTRLDKEALRAIQACGFLGVNLKGEPYLETNLPIGRGRMQRLIALDTISPNRDSLFPGLGRPQSYALTSRGEEMAGGAPS